MKINDDIHSITYLKSRAAQLLAQINETHRPVIITQNGEPRAVVQDPETFEKMKQAVGLIRLLAQGESDIRSGDTMTQQEVFKKLRNKIKRKTRNEKAA